MKRLINTRQWVAGDLVFNGSIDAKEPHMLCVVVWVNGDETEVRYLNPARAGKGTYHPPLKDLHDPLRWVDMDITNIYNVARRRDSIRQSTLAFVTDQVERGYKELWLHGWSVEVVENGFIINGEAFPTLGEVVAYERGYSDSARHHRIQREGPFEPDTRYFDADKAAYELGVAHAAAKAEVTA